MPPAYKAAPTDDSTMEEYQRKQLLERVGREGATVGASIPDEIDLDGEAFPLRDFVFEIQRLDAVPADRREEVASAKRNLRRARTERVRRLEEDALDYETGERLADEVVGIDRALNALESLGSSTDVEGEMQRQETADTKRWHAFLQKALGREESRGRSR